MVIYADDALKQLRDACKNYNFEMTDLSEAKVVANVTLNNITTEVWFDVDRQLFAFKLFQGGSKSFQNIDAFKGVFDNYMHCYGVLKPIASHITAYFESEFKIQTIFNTISGNVQNGFKAIFNQVGTDNEIHVYESDGNYRADYVEYNSDKTASSLIATKLYSSDLEEVITLDFYQENIMTMYSSKNTGIELRKIGDAEFRISGAGTVCEVKFMVEDSEVTVHIEKAKSDDFKLESSNLFVELKNPYDLMEIIRKVEEYKVEQINRQEAEAEAQAEADEDLGITSDGTDDLQEDYSETEVEEDIPESSEDEDSVECDDTLEENNEAEDTSDIISKDEDSNEFENDTNVFDDENVDSDTSLDSNSDTDSEVNDTDEEQNLDEELSSSNEDAETKTQDVEEKSDAKEVPQSLDNKGDESVKMELKAIKEDNKIVGVLLLDDNIPYTFSVETASKAGIPVKRLNSETILVNFRGIKVTEDEKKLKRFSEDLNDNPEKLSALLDIFFDD